MTGWNIIKGSDNPIPTGKPELKTSTNMKTVGIILPLPRFLCIKGKSVETDGGFYVLKVLLKIVNRGVYGSELIKKMILAYEGSSSRN